MNARRVVVSISISLITVLILTSCALTPKRAYERFDLIEGTLVVDPEPENGSHRLTLWIKIEDRDDDGEIVNSYVLRAICFNDKTKTVLPNLAKELTQVRTKGAKVLLLGNHWSGPWMEKIRGVDFIVAIVGYENPRVGGKEEMINVAYGTRLYDALASTSYSGMVKKLGSFVIDKAF